MRPIVSDRQAGGKRNVFLPERRLSGTITRAQGGVLMDRSDIDEEAIYILDRFYASTMQAVAWPLAGVCPGEPMSAVLAWLRAGARDPRCLWWVVERYGVAELIEALDEARDGVAGSQVEAAHAWAMTWLRMVASEAWCFENGADAPSVCTFSVHKSGARIWESRG